MRTLCPLLLTLAVSGLVACGSVKNDGNDSPDASVAHCPVCDPHATCQDTTCVCGTGYEGTGETCSDVDECATDNGGCDSTATCTNTDGGRECACPADAFGDGLTCRAKWVLAGSFAGLDLDPEGFGAKAAGVGAKLFFGADANGPGGPFMRSFDTVTGVLSPPLALPPGGQSDFCACGLSDVFLGDSDLLYMLGNQGMVYKPATNAWSAVAPYLDPFRRGEAAGAIDPSAQHHVLYLVGGRDSETGAIQLDLGAQTFTSLPGTVPFPVNEGRAWVFSGDSRLYVAGGSGGARRLASFVVANGTGTWTLLPDSPQSINSPIGMGEFDGRLWVASSSVLAVYDPAANAWQDPVQLPPGAKASAVVGDASYVLCKTAAGTEIYRLNAIE